MLLSQLLHASEHKRAEIIQDICEQDEFLRVEQRSVDIVEELGALDGDTHACNLVFLLPELFHLLVEALKLLSEILGTDQSTMAGLGRGCGSTALLLELVESGLACAESDSTVNVTAALAVSETDIKVLGLWAEHVKDLFLLGLPVLELSSVHIFGHEVFL